MDDPARTAGGTLGEYAYTGRTGEERSAADVLKDIVGNLQEIIRSEVRLARAEIREETGKLANAGKMFAIGAVLGIFALGFVLWSLAYGLASVMSPWLATLIVGLVLGVVAGILISSGQTRLKAVSVKPERTVENVKENIEWMKNQTR